jgi:hypothetical protein
VIKRNWKRAILALAVLSGLAVISWFIISYFHKAAVLARLLDPKLSVAGDIADLEEYTVYNAIISSDFVDASTELVVIDSHTSLGLLDVTEMQRPWKFEISDEAWNNFAVKNKLSSKLGNVFTLSKPYVFFDPANIVDFNWELSKANIHYTPFLEFSRVGFNSQKDEAIVHVGIEMLGASKTPIGFGEGHYIWLRKIDGIWKIEKMQETYIT